MVESVIQTLSSLPPAGILIGAFLIAYIENLFPPSPSDVALVFIGTLVGIGTVDFASSLLCATIGSTGGFATAYWIGRKYGTGLVEKGWVPFVTTALVERAERWFLKYHGWIIIGNRFLAGTRAVIAFAAGMTFMPFPRTLLQCAIGAIIWNAILIFAGMQVGSNWRQIDSLLSTYGWVVTGLIVVAIIIYIVVKRKRKNKNDEQ